MTAVEEVSVSTGYLVTGNWHEELHLAAGPPRTQPLQVGAGLFGANIFGERFNE